MPLVLPFSPVVPHMLTGQKSIQATVLADEAPPPPLATRERV
jgi:hypothetical protein